MNDYEAWIVAYLLLIGMAEVETIAPLAIALSWAIAIGYWYQFTRSNGTSELRKLIPKRQVGAGSGASGTGAAQSGTQPTIPAGG
jgi:hypothetical protein